MRNLLNYLQLIFISGAFSVIFLPNLAIYVSISIVGLALLSSFILSTCLNITNSLKIQRQKRVINSLEKQRLELRECLINNTQTTSYEELNEINNFHVMVIEEQIEEIYEIKKDLSYLHKKLTEINDQKYSEELNKTIDEFIGLFQNEPKINLVKRKIAKSSLDILKEKQKEKDEFTKSV